jgi:hypothetical protein
VHKYRKHCITPWVVLLPGRERTRKPCRVSRSVTACAGCFASLRVPAPLNSPTIILPDGICGSLHAVASCGWRQHAAGQSPPRHRASATQLHGRLQPSTCRHHTTALIPWPSPSTEALHSPCARNMQQHADNTSFTQRAPCRLHTCTAVSSLTIKSNAVGATPHNGSDQASCTAADRRCDN